MKVPKFVGQTIVLIFFPDKGEVTSTIRFDLCLNELAPFLRIKGHGDIFINKQIYDIICILFADVSNCKYIKHSLKKI